MSIFEYNEEEEKRKLRKAEYEAGKNDGIKIGREEEKRKIANSLFKEGDSIEKVARILCESEETIRGWVNKINRLYQLKNYFNIRIYIIPIWFYFNK